MRDGAYVGDDQFFRVNYVRIIPEDIDALQIREEKSYYPFGLQHMGYNNVITGRKHTYGYNGKEENDELGLGTLDFGARNYDPALGRWMNVDPLAEKYYDQSPFTYGLNNPAFFIDPDGREVDISDLLKTDQGKEILSKILNELSEITGAIVDYNDEGMLTIGKRNKDKGSKGAFDFLSNAIGHKEVVTIGGNNDKSTEAKENLININSDETDSSIEQLLNNDVDPLTDGYGFAVLHELGHTDVGASYFGEKGSYFNHKEEVSNENIPGKLVEKMNEFRAELQSNRTNVGTRKTYLAYPRTISQIGRNILGMGNSEAIIYSTQQKPTIYIFSDYEKKN